MTELDTQLERFSALLETVATSYIKDKPASGSGLDEASILRVELAGLSEGLPRPANFVCDCDDEAFTTTSVVLFFGGGVFFGRNHGMKVGRGGKENSQASRRQTSYIDLTIVNW